MPGAPAITPPDVRVPSGADLPAALAVPVTGALGVAIDNSRTYPVIADLADVTAVTIRATNLCRPVVRSVAPRWVFTGRDPGATLTLDGLLVTGGTDIVLQGSFAHVKLVCCTLDPGSWAGAGWRLAADLRPLAPSRLRLEGHVRLLELERCIVGPIVDGGAFGAETVRVRDSIVQAGDPAELALALRNGALELSRCTILGAAALHRADISESILHGVVTVEDVQHGCVRFTAWTEGSVLPRPYEHVRIAPRADLFVSRDFGAPGYAQLAAAAGPAILEGAEDDSEMGAFAREGGAIKERSILIKFQEYLPLGIEPAIVHVT